VGGEGTQTSSKASTIKMDQNGIQMPLQEPQQESKDEESKDLETKAGVVAPNCCA